MKKIGEKTVLRCSVDASNKNIDLQNIRLRFILIINIFSAVFLIPPIPCDFEINFNMKNSGSFVEINHYFLTFVNSVQVITIYKEEPNQVKNSL